MKHSTIYSFLGKPNSCKFPVADISLTEHPEKLLERIENGEPLYEVIPGYEKGFPLRFGYFSGIEAIITPDIIFVNKKGPTQIGKILIAPSNVIPRKNLEEKYKKMRQVQKQGIEQLDRKQKIILEQELRNYKQILLQKAKEYYAKSCSIRSPLDDGTFILKYGYFCTNDTMTEGNDTYIKEGEEASPPRISKIYIAPSIQKVQRKDLEKQYFEQFGEGEEDFEKTNIQKNKLLELLSSPAQEFYKESCAIIKPINEDVFVLNEEQVGYKKGLSLDQRLTNSL